MAFCVVTIAKVFLIFESFVEKSGPLIF